MKNLGIAVAAMAIIVPTASAQAQNVGGAPNYGDVSLRSGFTPDPRTWSVQAGGSVDVSQTIGGSCVGHVSETPDLRLRYQAGSLPLFISATSNSDTTLVVNAPDGRWYCDDDSEGLNPRVVFTNPSSGRYEIWIGTYSEGQMRAATLSVSEIDGNASNGGSGGNGGDGGALDYNARPNFGEVTLRSGFTPDPRVVDLSAGGNIDAAQQIDGCQGHVTRAPDVRLNYTAGSLPLIISAFSNADTTLIVNAADGNWYCDDDSEGLNPRVRFNDPQSGRYEIWVGTYSGGGSQAAELHISEIR